jgi:hypothetical protein
MPCLKTTVKTRPTGDDPAGSGGRDRRVRPAFQNLSIRSLSGTATAPRKLISALGLTLDGGFRRRNAPAKEGF